MKDNQRFKLDFETLKKIRRLVITFSNTLTEINDNSKNQEQYNRSRDAQKVIFRKNLDEFLKQL